MADEMNRDMMDREMKGIKMPSLTLEPEEKEDSGFYEETEERAGAVDESMLSEEERKQVEAFVDQIDVSNRWSTLMEQAHRTVLRHFPYLLQRIRRPGNLVR